VSSEPAPIASPAVPAELSRLVRRVLVDGAVAEALTHEGDCGPKARCPNQPPDDPYRLLEYRRDSGGVLLAFCRCHHGRHAPGDADHALLVSAFRETLP
jgi:hypothetical protein